MESRWRWAGLLAALLAAPLARAHELVCAKTVDGEALVEIHAYPATVTYRWTILNPLTEHVSVVDWVSDSLFHPGRVDVDHPLPPGGTVSEERELTLSSFEACQALAGEHALACGGDAVYLDNRFAAGWDLGETQCTARVICHPAPPPPPPPPPDGDGATRTLGFWRTHVDAAAFCIAEGPLDLGGYATVDSLESLLGLLWGSPARFDDGARRDALAQARFLLARQTAVAICNERAFGTTSEHVALARDALGGVDCDAIRALVPLVTAFNEAGDAVPFPEGFAVGPATPRDARAIATDPSSPTGETCGQ